MDVFIHWLLIGSGFIAGLLILSILLEKGTNYFHACAARRSHRALSRFYDGIDYSRAACILDESPVTLLVGKRAYTVKPLKYKEVLRLLAVFDKLVDEYETKDNDNLVEWLAEKREEITWGVTYVLAFSKHSLDYSDKELLDEFVYIDKYLTWNMLIVILNIVVMQNDLTLFVDRISRFAGGLSQGKKKS